MSSNTYTLKIDIDDSKIRDLEKRIMAIMGMNGTQRSGVGSKMTSASKGGDTMTKNIAKLGIIAIGVGSLVGLVSKISGMIVDSSPMLKQMLKLLNFSVMLILRPIGDFIGFFLKPVIIFMLRKFVIPFYKEMRKPMMEAGAQLGENFVNDPLGSTAKIAGLGAIAVIAEQIPEYAKSLKAGALQIGLWFDDIFAIPGKLDFSALDTWVANTFSIDKLPTVDWTGIKAFTSKFLAENLPKVDFTWITNLLDKFSLDNIPKVDFTWITNLLDKFSLDNIPKFTWTFLEAFLGLFGILKVPTFSWSYLTGGLDKLKEEVQKFIDAILGAVSNLIAMIPGIGSGKNESGNTTNFIDLNMNGVDDLKDLHNLLPHLGDIFAGNGN